jgi:hypothetical protein
MNLRSFFPISLGLLLVLAACGGDTSDTGSAGPAGAASTGGAPGAPAPLLPADLPDALPVLKALEGKEGEEVAVVGRVQARPVPGRAMLMIVDDSVEDCTRTGDDGCKTPWDYCCRVDQMRASLMLVELRGADGQPLKIASHGVRELDLITVKGTLRKGEGGRLMLVAKDGWHLRSRPKVSARIKFPD